MRQLPETSMRATEFRALDRCSATLGKESSVPHTRQTAHTIFGKLRSRRVARRTRRRLRDLRAPSLLATKCCSVAHGVASVPTACIASAPSCRCQTVRRAFAVAAAPCYRNAARRVAAVTTARVVATSCCSGHPVRGALSACCSSGNKEKPHRHTTRVREDIGQWLDALDGRRVRTMLPRFLLGERHWLNREVETIRSLHRRCSDGTGRQHQSRGRGENVYDRNARRVSSVPCAKIP